MLDQLFGAFNGDSSCAICVISILITLALGYFSAPLILWTIFVGISLVGWNAPMPVLVVFLIVAGIFNTPLRRLLVSSVILKIFQKAGLVPKISDTERTALEAGVVWIESELFSGKPNFKRILKEPYPELSEKEKKMVDEKCDTLCSLVDDWKYWETRELPKDQFSSSLGYLTS